MASSYKCCIWWNVRVTNDNSMRLCLAIFSSKDWMGKWQGFLNDGVQILQRRQNLRLGHIQAFYFFIDLLGMYRVLA